NQHYGHKRVEVINAGTHGWSSAESLINFQFRLLELNPDMIVVYEGINDTFAMRKPGEGLSDYSTFRERLNYTMPPAIFRPLFDWSTVARLAYFMLFYHHTFDICSLTVKGSPVGFDELTMLNKATGKYFKRNIQSLITLAKGYGVKPVLVTIGHGPWHPS